MVLNPVWPQVVTSGYGTQSNLAPSGNKLLQHQSSLASSGTVTSDYGTQSSLAPSGYGTQSSLAPSGNKWLSKHPFLF